MCYTGLMQTAPLHVEDVQKMAARVVRAHIPDIAYRIFLFGSRAEGRARDRSDIDIGIEGPRPVPFETLTAITDDLENLPSLYSVDIVDFSRMPERFRQVAHERRYLDLHPL